MPIDRSVIHKGMFLTSAGGPCTVVVKDHTPVTYGQPVQLPLTPPPTSRSLEVKLALKRLMQRHGVVPEPCYCPHDDPEFYDIIVEGFATTPDIDRERMLLAPHALLPSPYQMERSRMAPVPLLYKHNPDQVAGTIEELHYDQRGRLYVRARVHHHEAKKCGAFSVGLSKIREYSLHDVDTRKFYARITRATLDEVSLTDQPANEHARITCRWLTPEARAIVQRSCVLH